MNASQFYCDLTNEIKTPTVVHLTIQVNPLDSCGTDVYA